MFWLRLLCLAMQIKAMGAVIGAAGTVPHTIILPVSSMLCKHFSRMVVIHRLLMSSGRGQFESHCCNCVYRSKAQSCSNSRCRPAGTHTAFKRKQRTMCFPAVVTQKPGCGCMMIFTLLSLAIRLIKA